MYLEGVSTLLAEQIQLDWHAKIRTTQKMKVSKKKINK